MITQQPLISPRELSQLALILSQREPPKVIIEVGSYAGGSLRWWADHAAPDATIISVDDSTMETVGEHAEASMRLNETIAELNSRGYDAHRIDGHSHSPETLHAVREILDGRTADILFIDADHRPCGVVCDVEFYSPLCGGLLVLHDCATTGNDASRIGPHAAYSLLSLDRFSMLIEDDYGIGVVWME